MHTGKLVFAPLMEHLPLTTCRRCVAGCGGHPSKLYHLGVRSKVARNTLANANATRAWRIYCDFAQSLIAMTRRLYINQPSGVDLKDTVYALYATTIELCLSVFPWAPFRSTQAAIKLHTLLDLPGNLPSFNRCRWQVELFFKWIKQHLRIRAFCGTTENTVKTQTWMAISVCVLIVIVKKRPNLSASRFEILQILSRTVFERVPMIQLLTQREPVNQLTAPQNQSNLFK